MLQQVNRTYVRQRGRTLSYFGGCDYFRLASHPSVLAAVREGLQRYGLNVAASRRTSGNWEERIKAGRTSMLKMPGILPVQGGVPIVAEGTCIGAVGVSGVQSHEDEQIAQAGIDAVRDIVGRVWPFVLAGIAVGCAAAWWFLRAAHTSPPSPEY